MLAYARAAATAAAPARREEAHPHLRLLEASRLVACDLPTLSSASSANSGATGLMNRVSKTLV